VSEPHATVHVEGPVATIVFSRPEKKNAMTVQMYEEVVAGLRRLAADPAVRVVVLTGAGSAFTSGNDLADFAQNPPTGEDSPVFQLLLTLASYEKPVLAAVNGAAVGIGVTMLLHCDVVYASEAAKFTMPFVPLGLSPEGGSSYLLPRIAGHAKASELLLFGEPFDAATAHDVGLVARVVPAEGFLDFALSRARTLASRPAASVRIAKRLMKDSTREAVGKALPTEAVEFAARLGSPEAAEAFAAFFEKRKPDFTRFE
jgi:enoyl-CoA hydratase/carnithine racemase